MSSDYNTPLNYAKRNQTFSCQNCNKVFKVPLSRAKRGNVKFCSKQCYGLGGFAEVKNNIQCLICNKLFSRKPSHVAKTNFCSRICRSKVKSLNQITVEKRSCQVCFNLFTPKSKTQKFCSYDCSGASRKTPESFTFTSCKLCGKQKKHHISQKIVFCSKSCYSQFQSSNACVYYSRGKGGERADLNNLFVRSIWEANWARYLNYLVRSSQIKSWEYEAETFEFDLIGKRLQYYTPDFKILNLDGSVVYHEVKGWMNKRSFVKLRYMATLYPAVNLNVIDKTIYFAISKQYKKSLNWE